MSRFKKKAERKGPKVYRVRDVLEMFKNGKALIRIYKFLPQEEHPAWTISIYWDYTASVYNLCAFPAEILNRLIFKVEIADKGNTINIYI